MLNNSFSVNEKGYAHIGGGGQGDIGGCEEYFQSARHIKMNDVNLILGQAVLFLKKCRIEKAIG